MPMRGIVQDKIRRCRPGLWNRTPPAPAQREYAQRTQGKQNDEEFQQVVLST
jgi:hypothetical protein